MLIENSNPEAINDEYAGVFIITKSKQVIAQLRDNKPTIDNPGKLGTFGGGVELGEDPLTAAIRELNEETNLNVRRRDLVPFHQDRAWRPLVSRWVMRHFFSLIIPDKQLNTLEVYEGQGWSFVEGPNDPRLIESWRPLLKKVFDAL